jgi:hypothetical protein
MVGQGPDLHTIGMSAFRHLLRRQHSVGYGRMAMKVNLDNGLRVTSSRLRQYMSVAAME